jgi:hypothetical protein
MHTSTSVTKSALEATSSSTEFVMRRHQEHLQRRSDLTQTDWLWIIFCGIVGMFLGWACFFECSKSDGKRKRQERESQQTKARSNEEVSRVIARELRRGNDERSQNRRDDGTQHGNEQPNASGALREIKSIREGDIEEIQLGMGIKRVPPIAKPPPYRSEEEFTPYLDASRTEQPLGRGDVVIEISRLFLSRNN